MRQKLAQIILASGMILASINSATAEVSEEVLNSIQTPNEVETSIGTLRFNDGAPTPETADKIYDYLDTTRAMDTFSRACQVLRSKRSSTERTPSAQSRPMK